MILQDKHIYQITQLGRYEIMEIVGEGEASIVYKAADRKLRRVVALKMLKPSYREEKELVQRFTREAEVIANLSHPNIISVYDIDNYQGHLFFTMEFIDGCTLAQYISRKGILSYLQALIQLEIIASVLEVFYLNGIVHRDLSPTNIMITRQGLLKVMDFSIVKILDSTLSKTGILMGTFEYCSPEQIIEGKKVDIRTDIYAAGCILYFMLTGQHPFSGKIQEVIEKQLTQPIPYIPSLPNFLHQLLTKMTAKDPEERYATPFELKSAIQECRKKV